MKPFSELFPYILPFAPSAPDPLVEQYARQAAIEFCQRTRCWRDVQELDVTGQEDEIVGAPQQSSIYEIESGHFKGASDQNWRRLERVEYDAINPDLMDSSVTELTAPKFLTQASFDTVIVAPRAAGTLRLVSYLTPKPDAEYGPDFIFERYPRIIADGVLSNILMLPEQPYTNPNLGALKAGMFNSACDQYFSLNVRGQQRAPARVRSSFV